MKQKIEKEDIEKYNLTLKSNGWYFSQQGLILTEDMDIDVYLSKVFLLNELDERHNNLILKYDNKRS